MAEPVQKKRTARSKKSAEDEPVLVNEPTDPVQKAPSVRKASTKAQTKAVGAEDVKPVATRKPRTTTKKTSVETVGDESVKKPSSISTVKGATTTATKRAKTSPAVDRTGTDGAVKASTATPATSRRMKKADPTVKVPSVPVKEAMADTVTVQTKASPAISEPLNTTPKPPAETSIPSPPSEPVTQQKQQPLPTSPSRSTPTTATPAKPSSFMSSFINDPEPAPSGGTTVSVEEARELRKNDDLAPHSAKARAAAASRARAAASSDTAKEGEALGNPVAGGKDPAQDQIDTMMRIRAYGAQSFAKLRAERQGIVGEVKGGGPAAAGAAKVQTPTVNADAVKPTTAPTTFSTAGNAPSPSKATPPAELTAKVPPAAVKTAKVIPPAIASTPVATSLQTSTSATTTKPFPPSSPPTSTQPNPANVPPHPPATTSSRLRSPQPPPKPSATTPFPSNLPKQPFLPSRPPPPPRKPTEMPLAELKKNPEFKRLSWKWTSLLIALPFAIAIPPELWRRYAVLRAGRVAGRYTGEPKATGAHQGNGGEAGQGRILDEVPTQRAGEQGAWDGIRGRGNNVRGWGSESDVVEGGEGGVGGGGRGRERGMRNGGI